MPGILSGWELHGVGLGKWRMAFRILMVEDDPEIGEYMAALAEAM